MRVIRIGERVAEGAACGIVVEATKDELSGLDILFHDVDVIPKSDDGLTKNQMEELLYLRREYEKLRTLKTVIENIAERPDDYRTSFDPNARQIYLNYVNGIVHVVDELKAIVRGVKV